MRVLKPGAQDCGSLPLLRACASAGLAEQGPTHMHTHNSRTQALAHTHAAHTRKHLHTHTHTHTPLPAKQDDRLGPAARVPELNFLNKISKFKSGGR